MYFTMDIYLTGITCEFSPFTDMSLVEFQHFLTQRYHGIGVNSDYVINIKPDKKGYYVTGIGKIGSQAVASVALGHRLKVNRVDIACDYLTETADRDNKARSVLAKLDRWYSKFKPLTNKDSLKQASFMGLRSIYGTRTAPVQLHVFDMINGLTGFKAVYHLRNDWATGAWSYFEGCSDEDGWLSSARLAFSAVTNSYYGLDFFELDLPKDVLITRTRKTPQERDYWVEMEACAHRIVKESLKRNSAQLAEESVKFIETECVKLLQKKA